VAKEKVQLIVVEVLVCQHRSMLSAADVFIAVIVMVAATTIITSPHGLKWPTERMHWSQLV
jgi:uncharacterized membrane protein